MNAKLGFFSLAPVVLALAACGGGGSSNSNPATPPAAASQPAATQPTSTTITASQFAVYKDGQQDILAGAGSVSSPTATSAVLSLGADGNTTLTVTDPTQFNMSATGFYITNRDNGGIIMLCDQLATGSTIGTNTKSRYVAIATAASDTNQATQLTNSADLAGQTLYNIEDCSFQDKTGNPQGQNSSPDANTSSLSVDASGNFTFNNGNPALTAAAANNLLGGAANAISGGSTFLTAYKFSGKYVIVERGIPAAGNTTATGYVAMWITN